MERSNNLPEKDRFVQDSVRDDRSRPQYDKTNPGLQRHNERPQQVTTNKTGITEEKNSAGSSSGEEKDII